MNYDGEVIIGTKLDTKNLEKELKNAERQLQQYEKEAEKLKEQKAKIDTKDAQKQLDIVEEKITKIKNRMNEISTKEPLRMEGAEYKLLSEDLTRQENNRKVLLEAINEQYAEIDEKIKDNARNQALTNYKVEQLKNELTRAKGFDSIKNAIKNIGKEMDKNVKKVAKWALAVFGIRGAYMAVRNAMSIISQDDEQLKADIDYMRRALAYTLEPIVRAIVNLIKQLMFYIGYIIQRWTGKNIFENANKSLQNANSEAQKLNKTLTGFDEMNILNDNSTSGTVQPSFDLSNMEGEVPGWVKWISENGNIVIGIIEGIGSAIVALKLGKLLKTLGLFSKLKLWKLVSGLGLIIYGIIELIKDVIDFLKEPTWEKFGEILTDIGIILAGLAIIIGGLPLAIAAAIAIIVGLVISNWDTIKEVLGSIWKWIDNNVIKPIVNLVGGIWDSIKGGFQKIINGITQIFSGDFIGGISNIFGGLYDILIKPFVMVKNKVEEIFTGILNTVIDIVNEIIKVINKLPGVDLNLLDHIGETKSSTFSGGGSRGSSAFSAGVFNYNNLLSILKSKLPRLAVGGIINNPGHGVAIGGESGMEGVIPLTNAQQMELLGEMIGKYTTINLTNITQLDGRQIARKVEQINQNNKFVLNR